MSAIARNPVLPGCHPDPSAIRVGEDFYVVTSTFEWFPGLPIHRSRDLVEWELVGHAFDRETQLDLARTPSSGGLFAPTLRYGAGRFWIVCTVVDDAVAETSGGTTGNFVITAEDAAGPWSDPVWLPEAVGIDPSLLFDEDGRVWWCGTRLAEPGLWHHQTEVWVREFDPVGMRLVGDEHVVWHGAVEGAVWAEGPHLYRLPASLGGGVLLLASEGGTERDHAISAAHGDAPTGPFTGSRANPLLTHRHLGSTVDVWDVGHADVFDDGRGGWWALALADRSIPDPTGELAAPVSRGGRVVALQARETWLVPVVWEEGRPVFAPGDGRLAESVTVPWAADRAVQDASPRALAGARSGAAHPELVVPRTAPGATRLAADGDRLVLTACSDSLADVVAHAFAGFRLEEFRSRVAVETALPEAGLRVGAAVRVSDSRFLRLELGQDGGASLVLHVDGDDRLLASAPASVSVSASATAGEVELALAFDGAVVTASVGGGVLGAFPVPELSPSLAGGFFGAVGGAYALGEPGRTASVALEVTHAA